MAHEVGEPVIAVRSVDADTVAILRDHLLFGKNADIQAEYNSPLD